MKKQNNYFHSPIADRMLKLKKNIPHTHEDLNYADSHENGKLVKGESKLQIGYNVTSYFPNRRQRRLVLNQKLTNQRVKTNKRGVNPRPYFIQRVWNNIKQLFTNIKHLRK